jgi:hypothetical protein
MCPLGGEGGGGGERREGRGTDEGIDTMQITQI